MKIVGALLLVASLAWPASGATVQPSARKDFQIASDISDAVNRYPQFTIFDDVSVKVDRGVATLFGKVTMPFKRAEIEKRAAAVEGVTQVENRITVLPVSSSDDDLRQRIARSIYNDSNFWHYSMMPNPPIHIIVERSHVTLTGVVRNDMDRILARSLANQFGALSVTNALKTDDEVYASLEDIP
jgi:osmotically-inducible protein OsmY